MTAIAILGALVLIEAVLLWSRRQLERELRYHVEYVTAEKDLARQEVQALTDALGRANRTPILRQAGPKTLEQLDTWYGGKPQLTKVTNE